MRTLVVASCCVVTLGACASDDGGENDPPPPTGPWTAIERITFDPPIAFNDIISPTLSPDRLEMYVDVPGTGIARRTRATTADPFGPESLVNELFLDSNDPDAPPPFGPHLSPDGLRIYFDMYVVDADSEIWTSTRSSLSAAWGTPVRMTELGSASYEGRVSACAHVEQVVFESNRSTFQIYEFRDGQVRVLDELVAGSDVMYPSVPFITADCKTLFFGAADPAQLGTAIYVSHRDNVDDRWSAPSRVPELLQAGRDRNVLWVSPDQHHMLVEEYALNIDREIQFYALYDASR